MHVERKTSFRFEKPGRGDSQQDCGFFAWLGTDNGSTAYGILYDHGAELGVTDLDAIESDADGVRFVFKVK